jgi:hypothetical protein
MKDCTTFLKLQEAAINKQIEARRKGFKGSSNPRQVSKETTVLLKYKTSKIRDATMTTKGTYHQKDTSQQ